MLKLSTLSHRKWAYAWNSFSTQLLLIQNKFSWKLGCMQRTGSAALVTCPTPSPSKHIALVGSLWIRIFSTNSPCLIETSKTQTEIVFCIYSSVTYLIHNVDQETHLNEVRTRPSRNSLIKLMESHYTWNIVQRSKTNVQHSTVHPIRSHVPCGLSHTHLHGQFIARWSVFLDVSRGWVGNAKVPQVQCHYAIEDDPG